MASAEEVEWGATAVLELMLAANADPKCCFCLLASKKALPSSISSAESVGTSVAGNSSTRRRKVPLLLLPGPAAVLLLVL